MCRRLEGQHLPHATHYKIDVGPYILRQTRVLQIGERVVTSSLYAEVVYGAGFSAKVGLLDILAGQPGFVMVAHNRDLREIGLTEKPYAALVEAIEEILEADGWASEPVSAANFLINERWSPPASACKGCPHLLTCTTRGV